jgi:hypothetical protein
LAVSSRAWKRSACWRTDRKTLVARATLRFDDGVISMDVCVTTNSHDKKTLTRAVRLRDAALKIRALLQEWQPGVDVSSVQRGPFRIRYQNPATGFGAAAPRPEMRATRNDAWPRFGLEIVGKKPLLRAAWDGDAIVLVLFERGSWETQFLRLASAPRRNRRDTDRVADRIAGRLPQEP